MRRIVRSAWLWTMILLLGARPAGVAAGGPADADHVDRFLRDWEERASAITSLDARFIRTDRSLTWGDTKYSGRLVLGLPDQAAVEFSALGEDTKPGNRHERVVWIGRTVTRFDDASRVVHPYESTVERPGPPEGYSLPFLFQMDAEGAKARFDWKLLKRDDEMILIEARPRGALASVLGFERTFLWLDPRTFLPTRFRIYHDKSQDFSEFVIIDLTINEPRDIQALGEELLPGWAKRVPRRTDIGAGLLDLLDRLVVLNRLFGY